MRNGVPSLARNDDRQRFKERVRRWREDAIAEAVAELLREQGCLQLTMDEVAKRVGIAKGSLYLHAAARNDLVARVLDSWAADVPRPEGQPIGPREERWRQVCTALFSRAQKEGRDGRPLVAAFPCCLHTSPCPYGWANRWMELAQAYGLQEEEAVKGSTPSWMLLGEAIQALAATPSVRELQSQGHLAKAQETVERFVTGYGALSERH